MGEKKRYERAKERKRERGRERERSVIDAVEWDIDRDSKTNGPINSTRIVLDFT